MVVPQFQPVTHVIFDMDGLLLNTEPLYFKGIDQVCQKYGSRYTFGAKMKAMGRTSRESAAAVIEECKLPITVDQYLQDLDNLVEAFRNVDYMPGAVRLIQHLHSHKIPQAIATSSKKVSFEVKTEGKEDVLDLLEHKLLASDDPEVEFGKPHPDTFLVAARRFKNPPKAMENVLVFEDSPNGVQSALSAGMQVCWVPEEGVVERATNGTDVYNDSFIIKSLEEFHPELFGLPPF